MNDNELPLGSSSNDTTEEAVEIVSVTKEVTPVKPGVVGVAHSTKGTLAVLLVFTAITCGWVIRGVVSKQSPTAIEIAFAAVGLCALAVKPVESADISIQVVKTVLEKVSDKAASEIVEKL